MEIFLGLLILIVCLVRERYQESKADRYADEQARIRRVQKKDGK